MKIDRLLGIVIYLLNHHVASSKALAERFEASQRTIQRDMDVINQAGIPVISYMGSNGGYGISEGYSVDRQIASSEDYQHIITALRGLCSGYDSQKTRETLEKFLVLVPPGQSIKQKMILDFGVLKEDGNINASIRSIEKAIGSENPVEFDYTDVDNYISHRVVEPLLLAYKWYTWNLFGYCCEKKGYRLFRLSRINGLSIMDKSFSIKHRNTDELMAEHESRDKRHYLSEISGICSA